jgi:3-phenylpropionate/trans-cinnamate dioxygenase ferredoxin reductase subunit
MTPGVVIVGAGQAGFQVAASLRSEGYTESITLIGDEAHLPYQRPPLSKEFLLGNYQIEKVDLRPRAFYEQQRINLLTGVSVTAIDREARRVQLESGVSIGYSKLVLATGARLRSLPIDGALYLRTSPDAIAIRQRLQSAGSIVIVGGGFIGLEIAAAARTLGKQVTVIEAQPRLMARVVAPVISDFYRGLHTNHGVEILFGDHPVPAADLVVVGVGVIPHDHLARDAGLATNNGIAVDAYLRTSDDNIYAIGDCAEYHNPFAGNRVRLESVQNAVDQAKCAAANIAGKSQPYHAVPWFWTHQFDVMLQMAGLSAGADRVIPRGNPATGKFSVFYFKGEALQAIDSINRPADHMQARKLLAANVQMTAEQAADENLDLKSLLG